VATTPDTTQSGVKLVVNAQFHETEFKKN